MDWSYTSVGKDLATDCNAAGNVNTVSDTTIVTGDPSHISAVPTCSISYWDFCGAWLEMSSRCSNYKQQPRLCRQRCSRVHITMPEEAYCRCYCMVKVAIVYHSYHTSVRARFEAAYWTCHRHHCVTLKEAALQSSISFQRTMCMCTHWRCTWYVVYRHIG